jgi:hypothetical protein
LTNEKGTRSYINILKIYEKFPQNKEETKFGKKSLTIKNCEDKENSSFNIANDSFNMGDSKVSIKVDEIKKSFYVPVAICLWSHLSLTESFRSILMEFYKIVSLSFLKENEGWSPPMSAKEINNYQKSELLNNLIFIAGALKPPAFTKLKLNLRKLILIFRSYKY